MFWFLFWIIFYRFVKRLQMFRVDNDNYNENDNDFIEHKYNLQNKIIHIYDLLTIRYYVLYLYMKTNNRSE